MVQWKEWIKAAGIRAIRTFAEAMLAYIGTGAPGAWRCQLARRALCRLHGRSHRDPPGPGRSAGGQEGIIKGHAPAA